MTSFWWCMNCLQVTKRGSAAWIAQTNGCCVEMRSSAGVSMSEGECRRSVRWWQCYCYYYCCCISVIHAVPACQMIVNEAHPYTINTPPAAAPQWCCVSASLWGHRYTSRVIALAQPVTATSSLQPALHLMPRHRFCSHFNNIVSKFVLS